MQEPKRSDQFKPGSEFILLKYIAVLNFNFIFIYSYLFVYHVSNTCRPPYHNLQWYLSKLEFLKLAFKHLYLSSVQMYIFNRQTV